MDSGIDFSSGNPEIKENRPFNLCGDPEMEERRLSDLKEWVLANPTHQMVPEVMEQFFGTKFEEDDELKSCGLRTVAGSGKKNGKEPSGIAEIKWNTRTSAKLLKALDRLQLDLIAMEKKGYRPTCEKKWMIVSEKMRRKWNLDPEKFPVSCKVHLANLNRMYRRQKRTVQKTDLLPEIRELMDQYHMHVQQLRLLKKGKAKEVIKLATVLNGSPNKNPLDVLHAYQVSLPPRNAYVKTTDEGGQTVPKSSKRRKFIVESDDES